MPTAGLHDRAEVTPPSAGTVGVQAGEVIRAGGVDHHGRAGLARRVLMTPWARLELDEVAVAPALEPGPGQSERRQPRQQGAGEIIRRRDLPARPRPAWRGVVDLDKVIEIGLLLAQHSRG